jgi:hypothetical protein
MARSHYTYSVDAMREAAGRVGALPSRAEMSAVRSMIAEALGMKDEDVSQAIMEYALRAAVERK